MQIYDVTTETIRQGGVRRGANIAILKIDHPDILSFITSKIDGKRLRNFNISVAITDKFMEAREKEIDYDLINPRTGQVVKRISAKYIFDKIAEAAWQSGDPGVIFIDTINRSNPTPELADLEATNPCGEQPLLPYESCNLGSINLSKVVEDGKINYKKLGQIVDKAIYFLDNVIDINKYPLTQIEKKTKANRKIGLGVMGFADLLIGLGVAYNSKEAEKVAQEVMSFINNRSKEASADLAEKRGNFPNFSKSIYPKRGFKYLRNATTTTIAPTGSLSIIASCSSGIEPFYALAYERHILEGKTLVEINPLFLEVAKKRGFYSEGFLEALAKLGSLKRLKGYQLDEGIKRLFVTAYDISPSWHLRILAAFSRYTDNAVSKTINLPYEARIEDIKNIYLSAYKLGLKGVTIYRDRSKEEQVLMVKEKISPKPFSAFSLEGCPGCGFRLSYESGCAFCHHCGFSQCL
jgi:ribonucleoside-diphosphate reductase alpha chain